MFHADPLMPSAALLPLADTRCGGRLPIEHVPGSLRPFSATLGVVPIECGKHDTTATRWDETKTEETNRDGRIDVDTVTIPRTDT
ncbi:MAG: hypothetical protein ACRDSL_27405 [Pseudonocardiaceae bacterium]